MDRGAMLFATALFVILAGLTSIASIKTGEPDKNGAVAMAIKHHLADFLGMETIEGDAASLGPLVLCVGSAIPLEMEAIGRDLAGTVIRPVPVNTCTSETIEGDFGMFSAITKYYDAMGHEAAHLEVVAVSCSNTRTCVVDIDDFGAGQRYVTRKERQVWSVVDIRMRWIV